MRGRRNPTAWRSDRTLGPGGLGKEVLVAVGIAASARVSAASGVTAFPEFPHEHQLCNQRCGLSAPRYLALSQRASHSEERCEPIATNHPAVCTPTTDNRRGNIRLPNVGGREMMVCCAATATASEGDDAGTLAMQR
jgi:hypothetical protein